jgi:hypothetical protein
VDSLNLHDEAQDCRRKALCYVGRPEAPFLLHLARQFDRLAREGTARQRRGDATGEERRLG